MSDLEMKIEALIRCVGEETFENAMSEIKNAETPKIDDVSLTDIDVECAIREILTELGTPAHVKGYRYVITALKLAISDPEILNTITKGLYPETARGHNTTSPRVERAIRHAVEVTWDRGDLNVLSKYFGNTINADKGKPTNSEFLAMVSYIVRQRLNIR